MQYSLTFAKARNSALKLLTGLENCLKSQCSLLPSIIFSQYVVDVKEKKLSRERFYCVSLHSP